MIKTFSAALRQDRERRAEARSNAPTDDFSFYLLMGIVGVLLTAFAYAALPEGYKLYSFLLLFLSVVIWRAIVCFGFVFRSKFRAELARMKAEKAFSEYKANVKAQKDPVSRKVRNPGRIFSRSIGMSFKSGEPYVAWPLTAFTLWKRRGVILATANESFASSLHEHDRLVFIGVRRGLFARLYYWFEAPSLCADEKEKLVLSAMSMYANLKLSDSFWMNFMSTHQWGTTTFRPEGTSGTRLDLPAFMIRNHNTMYASKSYLAEAADLHQRLEGGTSWVDTHNFLFHPQTFCDKPEFEGVPFSYVKQVLGCANFAALNTLTKDEVST